MNCLFASLTPFNTLLQRTWEHAKLATTLDHVGMYPVQSIVILCLNLHCQDSLNLVSLGYNGSIFSCVGKCGSSNLHCLVVYRRLGFLLCYASLDRSLVIIYFTLTCFFYLFYSSLECIKFSCLK